MADDEPPKVTGYGLSRPDSPWRQSKARKAEFVERIKEGRGLADAIADVGIAASTYSKWRQRDREFAAQVDAARAGTVSAIAPTGRWTAGFAAFRKRYFGMDTPAFALLAIDAYEHTLAGNITMVLWPPEHGKTTLFEDFASYRLADDPTFRFTVGCEKQSLARKILGRVKMRMVAGATDYVRHWGPFHPVDHDVPQPWGADYFSVYKKGSHDERDYSMVGLGIGSQVAGTRTDHLHLDDIMSLRNLAQADKVFEVVRQDWLTRPGETGRTTVNGTRVGEGDVYELMDQEWGADILRVIKFPAVIYDDLTGERRPLWDERYTLEQLDRMRVKVGEEAWARNYMQQPFAASTRTFTEETISEALNPLAPLGREPERYAGCIITLDPAIAGKNLTMLLDPQPNRLKVLDLWEDTSFVNTDQIAGRLEDACIAGCRNGGTITDLVVETMAFQRGLAQDPSILRLADRFGFRIVPHQTGVNKYDEQIGVPSLASSMRRGEIELPYAEDDRTRYWMDEFVRQLKAWRPGVRGNRLRQDMLMALWFGWILWRDRAYGQNDPVGKTDQFRFQGLPWAPTGQGLLVPGGRR